MRDRAQTGRNQAQKRPAPRQGPPLWNVTAALCRITNSSKYWKFSPAIAASRFLALWPSDPRLFFPGTRARRPGHCSVPRPPTGQGCLCSPGLWVLGPRSPPAEGAPPPRQPQAEGGEGSQEGVCIRGAGARGRQAAAGLRAPAGYAGVRAPWPSPGGRGPLAPLFQLHGPAQVCSPRHRLTSPHSARRGRRAAARVPGRRPRCARPDAALCLHRSLLPPPSGRNWTRRTPPAREPRACLPPSPPHHHRRRRRPLGRAHRPAIRGGDPPAQRPPPRAPRPRSSLAAVTPPRGRPSPAHAGRGTHLGVPARPRESAAWGLQAVTRSRLELGAPGRGC